MAPTGISREVFGRLPSGEAVEAVRLINATGMAVRIISYGAAIQSVIVPDPHGVLDEVTLGHATLAEYLAHPQYAGATVGRVANRIAGARFSLNGREYRVAPNDGANALHGGAQGFDKANWKIDRFDRQSVALSHISPDGDQGFPGNLTVSAIYTLDDRNRLGVEYLATTDAPTLVNLSNHAYWNLAGGTSAEGALGHLLTLPADHYLPIDATLIPTGAFREVEGTAFDFRNASPIGARVRDGADEQIRFGRGYDHNWVVGRGVGEELHQVARLAHRGSGRAMIVRSNQPGIQFYSGNFFDATTQNQSGKLVRMGDAIALEPQALPDTPNRPEFGSIRLDPGATYRNAIEWEFFADGTRE